MKTSRATVIGAKWVVNLDSWGWSSKGIEEFQDRDVEVAGWRDRGAVTVVDVEFRSVSKPEKDLAGGRAERQSHTTEGG